MAGDTIIRIGEVADRFYILKKGRVQITATDRITPIAILEEGAYFGEIGLLSEDGKRSVEVKALTTSILACIDKENFLSILELFPDQKKFLLKVILIILFKNFIFENIK